MRREGSNPSARTYIQEKGYIMAKIVKSYCEWVLDEYPKTCDECPFFHKEPYHDNGYLGYYALCDLGYMKTGDTREFSGREIRWPKCNIEYYPYVFMEVRNDDGDEV